MIIGFDLDGTLIDTLENHIEAFLKAAKEMDIEVTRDFLIDNQGMIAEELISNVNPDIDKNKAESFLKLYREYLNSNIDNLQPFPETVSALTNIRKKAEIAIISNTHYNMILHRLEQCGLNPLFFDLIIGSDLVNHPKPFPDEIQIVEKIKKHKLDLYVGDTHIDAITGRRAKVKTVIISRDDSQLKKIKKAKPYKVIRNLNEIEEMI
ncbi:MAG: HAD family hydrolase [Candidatus Woesearchaeota archaeon]